MIPEIVNKEYQNKIKNEAYIFICLGTRDIQVYRYDYIKETHPEEYEELKSMTKSNKENMDYYIFSNTRLSGEWAQKNFNKFPDSLCCSRIFSHCGPKRSLSS